MDVKPVLLGSGYRTDPYPAYARLRQQGAVHRVELRKGVHCWVITRYGEARAAFADPRLSRDPRYASRAWKPADRGRSLEDEFGLDVHLLTTDPPDHTRLRGLVSKWFTPLRAEQMRDRIQRAADALIDVIAPRGECELIGDFAYPLAISVICELLGIPEQDHSLFRQWTSNAIPPAPGGLSVETPEPGIYLRQLVAAKRRAPADDLISDLIAQEAQLGGEAELLSMIYLLAIAGHENSVGLVGNGVLAFLREPAQLTLLHEDPALLGSAVEEILRFDGPMEIAAWRFAREPLTIAGTGIDVGDPVVFALAAVHRDPDWTENPDRFDITRPASSHLGFGHGIHRCLGAQLARVEARIALDTLLTRLSGLAIAVPYERIRRQPSSVVRGLYELPVTFTSRPARSA